MFASVTNQPKTNEHIICRKENGEKSLGDIRNCTKIRIMKNPVVHNPCSKPERRLTVYGTELTGETPREDFAEMLMPIAIRKNPRQYITMRFSDSLSMISGLNRDLKVCFSVLILF